MTSRGGTSTPALWPAPGKVDAGFVAEAFNAEVRSSIEELVSSGSPRPLLVGFLANGDPAGEMYAKMTKRACEKNGVSFELRRPERVDLEAAVIDANNDPAVHGILIYYPVFGQALDSYLRDVISVEKDVEGLSHRYRYSLYHNIRELEAGSGKKCATEKQWRRKAHAVLEMHRENAERNKEHH